MPHILPHFWLASFPHIFQKKSRYKPVSLSSVPVEAMFNLGVDPQSEEECTGGIPRQHSYVYSRQLF